MTQDGEAKTGIGRTGTLVAVAAAVLLAGVIGYRVIADNRSGTLETAPEAMSTPPTIEALRAAAEAAPDDAMAWQELGFAYFEAGMFDESVAAYDKASALASDMAVLWSSLGEARVMASDDEPMPAAALAAFRRALELDPADARARYFLAVERDLTGDHEGAIRDWLALLADSPPGAPWENDLVRTIEQVAAINQIDVTERIATASQTRNILPAAAAAPVMGAIPGPTQDQMAAAAALSPSQQQDMAEGMVERLATRLEREPGDVAGWIMLMRSYQTLGRTADARRAYRQATAANPASRASLEEAAATLGI